MSNKAKTIRASISVLRNSHDEVIIEIEDKNSRARFVRVTMSPHDFAMAVTGLSDINVSAEVVGLDVVGKKKVVEKRTAECPLKTYDKEILKKWLTDNCQEEGWKLDSYLGAQSSVKLISGGEGVYLNYRVYRYEEIEST